MTILLHFILGLAMLSAPDTLRGATVSARRLQPASGDSIGRKEMRNFEGVDEALRHMAGIQVRDYGGTGGLKTVNVRSLGSAHTRVSIDGIEVRNPQNAQVDLGRYSASQFEAAVVGSGAAGHLISPSQAVAGASVNLVTAAPLFREGETDRFRFSLGGGSFNTFSPSLSWALKTGRNTAMSLSARYRVSDGRYRFRVSGLPRQDGAAYDTTMLRENSDYRSFSASATANGAGWKAQAFFFDSERGLPGPVVRKGGGIPLESDRQEDRNFHLQGEWTPSKAGRALVLRGKYWHDHLRFQDMSEENPLEVGPEASTYETDGAQAAAALMLRLSQVWSLDFSGEACLESMTVRARGRMNPGRLTAGLRGAFSGEWERVTASASLAYIVDESKSEDGRSGHGYLAPCLDFSWMPSERFSAGAYLRKSCRLPSLGDIYFTGSVSSKLKSEKAAQACAYLDISPADSWKLRTEIYHNRVTDKIIALPRQSLFRWSMINLGKASITGVETKLSHVCGHLRLDLRYSWQQALDRSRPGQPGYGGQLPYIPRHSADFTAGWESGRWALIALASFCSERFSSSANFPEYRLAPWFCGDLSCRFSIAEGLDISLYVKNITSKQYEIIKGYPMPGASLSAKLEWSFSISDKNHILKTKVL